MKQKGANIFWENFRELPRWAQILFVIEVVVGQLVLIGGLVILLI